MDGLLVVDKPAGPTSHEVVARVRRALGEQRVGHTGTLDPAATGVLPLVVGRATRLARFLSESDKSYEAVFRLGVATDTDDAQGAAIGATHVGATPVYEAVNSALDAYRGTFLQTPPAYSAKKVDGVRSYRLARSASRRALVATDDASPQPAGPAPKPVQVTARTIDLIAVDGATVTLAVTCSAGFYVRALARDLGDRLGVGAHVVGLRRTRSGDITLERAIALDQIERDPELGRRAVAPLSSMLPGFESVTLTLEGVQRALHGCDVPDPASHTGFVRLVDPEGDLVAIASPARASGLLHPAVVLM